MESIKGLPKVKISTQQKVNKKKRNTYPASISVENIINRIEISLLPIVTKQKGSVSIASIVFTLFLIFLFI